MLRTAMREFCEKEIKPHLDELEHGTTPPYDVLRKLYRTFGMHEMAAASFDARIAAEKAAAEGLTEPADEGGPRRGGGSLMMIPIIELCHWCPGMVTALGVSVGLTAAAIMSKGTTAQKAPTPSAPCARRQGATATSTC
jgi:alkylation response protein AidB-like acyl-CoA dehydrogenase